MKKFIQQTGNIIKKGKAVKSQRNFHTSAAPYKPSTIKPIFGTNDDLLNPEYIKKITDHGKNNNPLGIVEAVKLTPQQKAMLDSVNSPQHRAFNAGLAMSKSMDYVPVTIPGLSENLMRAWSNASLERESLVKGFMSNNPKLKPTVSYAKPISNKGKGQLGI
ncbi:MAG: hypothetical protein K0Q51_1422 [Rickettsiaceae bacterium]|nr:hypothetical protein [Rickettsiaceae bacterium]